MIHTLSSQLLHQALQEASDILVSAVYKQRDRRLVSRDTNECGETMISSSSPTTTTTTTTTTDSLIPSPTKWNDETETHYHLQHQTINNEGSSKPHAQEQHHHHDNDDDPIMAAFLASQQIPTLNMDDWAFVIVHLEQKNNIHDDNIQIVKHPRQQQQQHIPNIHLNKLIDAFRKELIQSDE